MGVGSESDSGSVPVLGTLFAIKSSMSGFLVFVVSHQLVKDGDSVEKVTFSATCTGEPESSISGDITNEVR